MSVTSATRSGHGAQPGFFKELYLASMTELNKTFSTKQYQVCSKLIAMSVLRIRAL
jgi:hypothetical protein